MHSRDSEPVLRFRYMYALPRPVIGLLLHLSVSLGGDFMPIAPSKSVDGQLDTQISCNKIAVESLILAVPFPSFHMS